MGEQVSSEFNNLALDEHDQGESIVIDSVFPHQVRGDGVVLVPDAPPTVSKGGVALVDTRETAPRSGVVLALGPGKRHEDGTIEVPDFKVGARVVFSHYAGTRIELQHQGRSLLLLRLDEVRIVLAPGTPAPNA